MRLLTGRVRRMINRSTLASFSSPTRGGLRDGYAQGLIENRRPSSSAFPLFANCGNEGKGDQRNGGETNHGGRLSARNSLSRIDGGLNGFSFDMYSGGDLSEKGWLARVDGTPVGRSCDGMKLMGVIDTRGQFHRREKRLQENR